MATSSSPLHAYFGTDEGQVREAARVRVDELVPESEREFGLETIDGTSENSEGAAEICRKTIEAIQTLPFLGGDKCVWLRGANFFADDQTGKSETTLAAQESLLEVLQKIPSGVSVVLSGGKISKVRRFYKGLAKLTKVEFFDQLDLGSSDWPIQAAAHVGASARKRGLNFDSSSLELFVMLVGADSAQLDAELEKLDLYLGDERTVTEEAVRATAARTRGGIIFEIGAAISKKNLALALARSEALLDLGENAVGIMRAAVIPQVRSMLYSCDLAERHGIRAGGNYQAYAAAIARLPDEETAHLPQKKAGGVNAYGLFLASQAGIGGYTTAKLAEALEICLKADEELVTTATPPLTVLTKMLVGIMA